MYARTMQILYNMICYYTIFVISRPHEAESEPQYFFVSGVSKLSRTSVTYPLGFISIQHNNAQLYEASGVWIALEMY